MEEIKLNKVALILVVLIGFFILVFPPFVASIYVPILIRLPLLLLIVVFSLLTVISKRYFVATYLPVILIFFFLSVYWTLIGAPLGDIAYLFLYAFLAIVLLTSVKRNKSLKFLLIKFYFFIVLIFSILSIFSFLAYNLKLAPYKLKAVGEGLDVYMHYHNYIFGYINSKGFDDGDIGRVCGFMFEPSYQGWFLSSNFFLLSKFVEKKNHLFFLRLIVFLGAISTFSTMSWIVFSIVFGSILVFKIMSILGIKEKMANILYISVLALTIIGAYTIVDQNELFDMFGPSSAADRSDRAEVSILYLVTASPKELILGRGPGFIVLNNDKGESNPIVKSLVENGMIITVLVLIWIVYCTYRSKYYLLASLLWLNSVVILFTPLFIINILVCKWMDEANQEKLFKNE